MVIATRVAWALVDRCVHRKFVLFHLHAPMGKQRMLAWQALTAVKGQGAPASALERQNERKTRTLALAQLRVFSQMAARGGAVQ